MADPTSLKAIIGPPSNPWTYQTSTGFDLTRQSPSPNLTISTTTTPIQISPSQTALIIIDMQNFFLSPSFGRSLDGAGHRACTQLLENAIPAARKAGIRIVWCNWGLTDEEVASMPAGVSRAFGFAAAVEGGDGKQVAVSKFGRPKYQGGDVLLENGTKGAMHSGLGSPCGEVQVEDKDGEKKKVDAGRLLMRDTWNAALYMPLEEEWEVGRKLERRPDVWVHKNRMSGLWGASTDLEQFLRKEDIRTLLFAGVNTDQCVGGTLTDAFGKGYDCVLLSDGCGTTSPPGVQEAWEWNAANTFGFCASCGDLSRGVEKMGG